MSAVDIAAFRERCLLLDLETSRDGRLRRIGAVHGARTFERHGSFDFNTTLEELDHFAAGAELILGHNVVAHDLPVLRKLAPALRLLERPAIDTLLLSPLAFPEHPYHPLIKTYRDDGLRRDAPSDPVEDALLAWHAFELEWEQITRALTRGDETPHLFRSAFEPTGIGIAFGAMGAHSAGAAELAAIFSNVAVEVTCRTALSVVASEIVTGTADLRALAYTAAWLPHAGSSSIIPHFVRYAFPEVARLVRRLRGTPPCDAPSCRYCREANDATGLLDRFFGAKGFIDRPATADGRSLQGEIVRAGLADKPLLAIVPTGGGKSIGYQLPALARNRRRGALTVVISPLQALMRDQVEGVNRRTGSHLAAAIHGLLTMPERGEVLARVRMGDVAILYVSPEQLRNRSFRRAIEGREIGAWIFDEAHCLSQWGHDFRPDYLYAVRFIREQAADREIPPIGAFTATAKRDVKEELLRHFDEALGQRLEVFEASVERPNLTFEVRPTSAGRKLADVAEALRDELDPARRSAGSAIVYLSTHARTTEMAAYLRNEGLVAEHFHGGLDAPVKRRVQDDFLEGRTPIICATNAFGMGIDKPDVRLVIHADIPGSLEAYLQEAGRAGRDRQPARCVLFFTDEDVDVQFRLQKMSELTRREIAGVLRAIRRAKRGDDERVIATTADLLNDEAAEIGLESPHRSSGTQVKSAIGWLERARLVERDENDTRVFQGRPRVTSLAEAEKRIDRMTPPLPAQVKKRWLALLAALLASEPDEGLTADDLAMVPEVRESLPRPTRDDDRTAGERIMASLHAMAREGLIEDAQLCTAFVRWKVSGSSEKRLASLVTLDRAMIAALRAEYPEADSGEWVQLSLRHLNQRLLDEGLESRPDALRHLLASLEWDGRGLAGQRGSIERRYVARDLYRVRLHRSWTSLEEIADLRRSIAAVVLRTILARVPEDRTPSADTLVQFALADLTGAMDADLALRGRVRDRLGAAERGLTFLHEQGVIHLQQGLAVFRQAMTIRLLPEAKGRGWTSASHSAVEHHYGERTFQIHVMAEYARLGLEKMTSASGLVTAYFTCERSELVRRYFAEREDMLARAATAESYRRIVGDLRDPAQTEVVTAPVERNMLVLAGPGAGKTRVVVHRVAWLVRVRHVRPAGILVLAFNRSAAHEIRARLRALIGDDARHVTVLTYHALALRLTGRMLAPSNDTVAIPELDAIVDEATALLTGDNPIGLTPSHILVDEYQDIDERQYRLIAALAAGVDPESEVTASVLAVGDDDQNIYAFRETNVAYIRRFEEDYRAKQYFLVENYRSSGRIVDVANLLIRSNRDRMKAGHPITVNARRARDPKGGRWAALDLQVRGRVQVIEVRNRAAQAGAIRDELQRLRTLDPSLTWDNTAVLARHHVDLDVVRLVLEAAGIPVRSPVPREKMPSLFRLREVARFLDALRGRTDHLDAADLRSLLDPSDANPWTHMLIEIVDAWVEETGGARQPAHHIERSVVEGLLELRRSRTLGQGVLLSTIHGAKGLELDHVLLTDPGSSRDGQKGSLEEERRVLYVGMTRAKQTLALFARDDGDNPLLELTGPTIHRTRASPRSVPAAQGRYTLLDLSSVYLDFASRFAPTDPLHAALAALAPGSEVHLRRREDAIEIEDRAGVVVGALSKRCAEEWLPRIDRIVRARTVAIVRRSVADLEPDQTARCRTWEVPVLELLVRN